MRYPTQRALPPPSASPTFFPQLIEKAVRITKPGGVGGSDLDQIESKLTSGFSISSL